MIETEYLAPRNIDQLFEGIQGRIGQVKFMAGCTNVLPNLRARAISSRILVDLTGIEEIAHIREGNGVISIGALTTMTDLAFSEIIQKESPILASAARQLGNPLTRNRATIGGNLADASPAADMAPPLLALEATIHTAGPEGKGREISLDRFFLGPNKTVLDEDEIITRITIPKPKDPWKGSHIKFGLRNAMAISVASVALMLEMVENVCRKARVALGSLSPKPIRAYLVEKELEDRKITNAVLEQCTVTMNQEISPISDIRGSADYRRLVAAVLLKRAIRQAHMGRK